MLKNRALSAEKNEFVRSVRRWVLLLLALLALLMTAVILYNYSSETSKRAAQMRSEFLEEQKHLLRMEVEAGIGIFERQKERLLEGEKSRIRQMVYQAYSVASFIYDSYHQSKNSDQLRGMIIDAIRNLHVEGEDYFFVLGLDGMAYLYGGRPQDEGTNVLFHPDPRVRQLTADIATLVEEQGEGFHSYTWPRPRDEGTESHKISFVKGLPELDLLIGTGIYLDAVEQGLRLIAEEQIISRRFGAENSGYIFIQELHDINGGERFARTFASPNRPEWDGQFLADDYRDAKGKQFRKEMLAGLRADGECFVTYWYQKIGEEQPSPKIAFCKLSADRQFILGAGVYLDDIEKKIILAQKMIRRDVAIELASYFVLILLAMGGFYLALAWLSRRLEVDFGIFVDFFTSAVNHNDEIDRSRIRYAEFDQLAGVANTMVRERLAAEQALLGERERFEVIVGSIADGVIAIDPHGQVMLLNEAAQKLLAVSETEALGRPLSEVLKAVDDDGQVVDFSGHCGGEPAHDSDVGRIYLQGAEPPRQLVYSCAHISSGGDQTQGDVIVFRDETERLRQENEQFKVKRLESVSLLAGSIAHSFNNLLAGLFGNIELAQRKLEAGHRSAPYLKLAYQSLDRAVALSNQLLAFSKSGDPLLVPTDLLSLLRGQVEKIADRDGLQLTLNLAEDLWSVNADKGQLELAVDVLLDQALQSMPRGGTLAISAENLAASQALSYGCVAEAVKLVIQDQGGGLSQEALEQIFDPQFSAGQVQRELGLATARSIVEKHNGRIIAETLPDQGGILMTLLLPALLPAELSSVADQTQPVAETGAGQLRILVVDDDATILSVLEQMLGMCGYAVVSVPDGDSATEVLRENLERDATFVLAIVDLTLPDEVRGEVVAARLKALCPELEIIATSGHSVNEVMANFRDYGFSGRLLKPFQFADIRKLLDEVIG